MSLAVDVQLAWLKEFERLFQRIATALEVLSDGKTLEAYPAGATKPVVTEPRVTDPFAGFDVTDEVRASNPFDQHVFVPDRNRCDICGHTPSHPRHVQLRREPNPLGGELPHYGHVKWYGDPTDGWLAIFDGLHYVPYSSDKGYAVRNVLTEMLLGLERRVRMGK